MHALSAYCQAEFVIAYTISAVALSITLRVTSKQQRFKKKKKVPHVWSTQEAFKHTFAKMYSLVPIFF